MKIIEQSYQWENPSFDGRKDWTRWMYQVIEQAGRTCYKSETKGDPAAFVARIVKSGHHSVLEHISFSIRFITDRGVTHELVRHRLAAYSQESTRYCDYSGEMEFIRPVWGEWPDKFELAHSAEEEWYNQMALAESSYKELRRLGWSPQQARSVLPNSLKTEIVMTANLREWKHVLELRTAVGAHPQIRALMVPLLKEVQGVMPEVFGSCSSAD